MAKKPSRSGRPQPGGRVTAKGVRPATTPGSHANDAQAPEVPTVAPPQQRVPVQARRPEGMHAPTRAGHHRGQR